MKMNFPRIIAIMAFCGLAVVSTASAQGDASGNKTITIINKTTFNVDRVFLSHVSEDEWGDDLLGDVDVLKPGDSLEVEIECGKWDAKLVAEDESTCTVREVDICGADTWEITADC